MPISRIEWLEPRYQDMPDSSTLLTILFRDNHGNYYQWVPKWKEVRDLFFDAIVVEGDNTAWQGSPEIKRFEKLVTKLGHVIDVHPPAEWGKWEDPD